MNNTIEEVWKDIIGYEGLYKVSSQGRVWSCGRKIIRKQTLNKGYPMVKLHKGGKVESILTHRLVAMHYVENEENKPEVNHLDENKENNHMNNLAWVTSKENANWGTRNERIKQYVDYYRSKGFGSKSVSVVQIDASTDEVIRSYETMTEAAKETNIGQSNISDVCRGARKTTGGYKWAFAK